MASKGRSQHAYVRLHTAQDEHLGATAADQIPEVAGIEGRVGALVADAGGRRQLAQGVDELHQLRTRHGQRHRTPALVVPPPGTCRVLRPLRRDETGEHRVLGRMARETQHIRKDVRQDRGVPHRRLGEQPLHVHRDVKAAAREQTGERGHHGRTATVCSGNHETVTGSPSEMGRASRFCSSTVTTTSPHATP